jgi:hypothetical protein
MRIFQDVLELVVMAFPMRESRMVHRLGTGGMIPSPFLTVVEGRKAVKKITRTVLFSALLPHIEMEERQSLDWGEKFLDTASRRQLRERFEYQGSNIPVGAGEFVLARHKHTSTRHANDASWLGATG